MGNNRYISDDLLAAYLDGNTNEAETQQVIAAINAHPELRETLEKIINEGCNGLICIIL